jgi:hypothetical protein
VGVLAVGCSEKLPLEEGVKGHALTGLRQRKPGGSSGVCFRVYGPVCQRV